MKIKQKMFYNYFSSPIFFLQNIAETSQLPKIWTGFVLPLSKALPFIQTSINFKLQINCIEKRTLFKHQICPACSFFEERMTSTNYPQKMSPAGAERVFLFQTPRDLGFLNLLCFFILFFLRYECFNMLEIWYQAA